MSHGVILIDYANIFYGHEVCEQYVKTQLSVIVEQAVNLRPEIEDIEVRLYGGWRNKSVYTQMADKLNSIIEQLNGELFPMINRDNKLYGIVKLVSSQFGIDEIWENTYQEKQGIHRLKVKFYKTDLCHQYSEHCPVQLIAKATKTRDVNCPIEGCGYVDFSQLVRMEQKMVDTIMACDILEYTREDDYKLIVVVSDDIDIHPAMALAGFKYLNTNDCILALFVHNVRQRGNYQKRMSKYKVEVKLWD